MKNLEIKESAQINWFYPNIYGADPDTIEIQLLHTRAADSILISFDADRNGWVIRMDRTKDRGQYSEIISEKQEVAFVPAWNEE